MFSGTPGKVPKQNSLLWVPVLLSVPTNVLPLPVDMLPRAVRPSPLSSNVVSILPSCPGTRAGSLSSVEPT